MQFMEKVIKDQCKNDTSKMEPGQTMGYVSFVMGKIDGKCISNINKH